MKQKKVVYIVELSIVVHAPSESEISNFRDYKNHSWGITGAKFQENVAVIRGKPVISEEMQTNWWQAICLTSKRKKNFDIDIIIAVAVIMIGLKIKLRHI